MIRRISKIMLVLICIAIGMLLFFSAGGLLLRYGPVSVLAKARSPNGRYTAELGYRGLLDSLRGHLYLREGDGPTRELIEVGRGKLKWSPDSARIAIVDLGDLYRGELAGIQVYDAHTGQSAAAKWQVNLPRQLTDPRPDIDWEWATPSKLVFTLRWPSHGRALKADTRVVPVDVIDTGTAIRLQQRSAQ